MIDKLLPIGSVVLLNGGRKRIMVFGIKQIDSKNEDNEFDYIGVPYPEGNMGIEYQYLFNNSDIEKVVFRGYEDDERSGFINQLTDIYNKKNKVH